MRIATSTLIILTISLLVTIPATADENEAARQLALKLLDAGAAEFNLLHAHALAETYTDDAKVFVEIKNSHGLQIKEYFGRPEINKLYEDLFEKPETIEGKNTVEYARLLAPDFLVIAGTFVPNLKDAKPLKIPFYQVRIKQGEKWLISSLRVFAVLNESP
jgi:ketosteroid isomerase-like protein